MLWLKSSFFKPEGKFTVDKSNEKELFCSSIKIAFLSLPNKNEASPVRWLLEMLSQLNPTLPNDLGIGPDSRFSWAPKTKFLNEPKLSGIGPVKSLLSRRSCWRLVSRPREAGIGPDRWFLDKSNMVSFLNWPKKPGIGPVRLVRKSSRS